MQLFVEELDESLLGTRCVVIMTTLSKISAADFIRLTNAVKNKSCGAVVKRVEQGDGHIYLDKYLQDFLKVENDALLVAEKITPPAAQKITLGGLQHQSNDENLKEILGSIRKKLIGKPLSKGIEISEYGRMGLLEVIETVPDGIVVVTETTDLQVPEQKVKRSSIQTDSSENPGKSDVVPIKKPDIKFADVGGLDNVKKQIRKAIVDPYKHPETYQRFRRKAGEGILLYGPPGCGKTFIAKAAAGECDASFLSFTISDILDPYIGKSERNLREAFTSAKDHAPCIMFFDEIDGIGGQRGGQNQAHNNQLVNEFLMQLNGIGEMKDILILAATNAPWSVDPALRRPGRFSKLVLIPPPDLAAREDIFRIQLKGIPVDQDLDYRKLAELTDRYSSADIAQVCREVSDILIDEEIEGCPPRDIKMSDFSVVTEKYQPSLIPWLRQARRQIAQSHEEDLFKDLIEIIERYDFND